MLIKYTLSTTNIPNTFFPLTIQIGNTSYLLEHAKETFMRNLENHERHRVDLNTTEDYANLLMLAKQPSLFSQHLLIHGVSRKKTIEAAVKTQLLDYLKNSPDKTNIFLTLPEVSYKLLKEFIDHPRVLVLQTIEPSADSQKKWIFSSLGKHFKTVPPEVVITLFNFLEGNLEAIAARIEQISLLFASSHVLTPQDIEPLLIEQAQLKYSDFVLALLNGTLKEILRFLRYFNQTGEEPTLLLWIITQEIRAIIGLHFALQEGSNLKNACYSLKLWSSREPAYGKAMQRLPVKQLYFMLQQAKLIDDQIKSFNMVNVWGQLDSLTLKFC